MDKGTIKVEAKIKSKKWIIFIVIALIAFSYYWCNRKSDEELIVECIDEFVFCYNSGDIDGCVECLDAKSRNEYNAKNSLLGGLGFGYGIVNFNGLNLQSLFGLAISNIEGDALTVTINNIKMIDEETAEVYAYWQVDYGILEEEHNIRFDMKKEKGKWVIAGTYNFDLESSQDII